MQTHALQFEELNSIWTIDRARSRELDHSWRDPAKDDQRMGPAEGVEESEGEETEGSGGHGGGGGLWRAFIRDATFGTEGRPDLKSLAERYHALPAAEIERLTPSAKAATSRHGPGTAGSSVSAFGPTSREIQRALTKRKASLVYESLSEDSKQSLLCDSDSSLRVEKALEAALSVGQGQRTNFDQALREGRIVLRSFAAMKSSRLRELQNMVKTWAAQNQQRLMDELMTQLPYAAGLRDDTIALPPKRRIDIFQYRPNALDLANAASQVYVQGAHLNLSSIMQARFHKRPALSYHRSRQAQALSAALEGGCGVSK